MATTVAPLPGVGPLLGAAFDKAVVLFAARWRLLVAVSIAALLGGFLNIFVGFAVLWLFSIYWVFASFANTIRLHAADYRMGAADVARLIAIGIIYGIAVEIGFFLLIVPGVYLAVKWSLAQLICVVERCGVFEAFERSADITTGIFWQTLWFNIAAGFAVAAVAFAGYVIGVGTFGLLSVWWSNKVHPEQFGGGGALGVVMTLLFAIYVLAICFSYQAKDVALLYWYEALMQRRRAKPLMQEDVM